MPDDDDHDKTDDGLPRDPELRRAAVEAQADDLRAQIDALIEDATDATDEPEAVIVAPSETAWTHSRRIVEEQADVLEDNLAAMLTADVRALPFVLEQVERLNRGVAETVAALLPRSNETH